jgi:hypothetical protein
MSRAGQRARLDKLLEAIGPKIQRIRVEGGMPPAVAPAGPPPVATRNEAGEICTAMTEISVLH